MPGEGLQVLELDSVLGGDDEPELVPVALPLTLELLEIDFVLSRSVSLPCVALRRHSFPLQIP